MADATAAIDLPPAENKSELRARLRQLRKGVKPKQRVRAAIDLARHVALHFHDHQIAAYVSIGSEVSTWEILDSLWKDGRSVLLPMVNGLDLLWYEVKNSRELRSGYRGIQEPDPRQCPEIIPTQPWLCLVPGLGFTADGKRLGQGGGFYDRALAQLRSGKQSPSGCVVAGVGFPVQMLHHIPMHSHDQYVDQVFVFAGAET